ncbi:YncE family protein [Sciscionella marina]|uniref:YncE family protein n=1 Tax=Sciscionella marina TaxID=508770 RepID=UPI0003A902D5|nr:hypothetical protein [Sciscionella marina]
MKIARLAAALLAGALLAGCGSQDKDPLQVANNASAAKPASVPMSTPAKGDRIDTGGAVLDTLAVGRTLFLARADALLLYDLDDLSAQPRTVKMPGKPGKLSAVPDGVLVPVGDSVLTVSTAGRSTPTEVGGKPSSAVLLRDGRLVVAFPEKDSVGVFRDGKRLANITGKVRPEQLFAVGEEVLALDPVRTALYDVQLDKRSFGTGVRAGQGAARGVTDNYGRVLLTDARSNQLLAFATGPVLMRQRYPVGKTPFGIAFDPTRKLIWVTVTGTNEVAGYAVGHGEPELKYRFPTVGSPDSVAVDPRSGTVLVGSAATDGLAVVRP